MNVKLQKDGKYLLNMFLAYVAEIRFHLLIFQVVKTQEKTLNMNIVDMALTVQNGQSVNQKKKNISVIMQMIIVAMSAILKLVKTVHIGKMHIQFAI